jgi:hypothetical protein
MIELLLRLFGLLMLAGGAVMAAVGLNEYGRAVDAPGTYGAQLALQFRIDATDAGLLLGIGLLCLAMATVLGVAGAQWQRRRDPDDDVPQAAREDAPEMDPPDPHEL